MKKMRFKMIKLYNLRLKNSTIKIDVHLFNHLKTQYYFHFLIGNKINLFYQFWCPKTLIKEFGRHEVEGE